MKGLINKASDQLIRRRASDIEGLLDGIYHSLVEYLGRKGLITNAAFDERPCRDCTIDDIAAKRISWFISRSVGTRSESAEAPVTYSVPQEVIAEAVVNAVAHRDYSSPSAVQVAVFSDRVEIRNSGRLPPELTLEQLKVEHASFPRNKQIANTLFLAKYIDQLGTGTSDIYRRCREAGLGEPNFEHVGTEFVFSVSRLESVLATIELTERQIAAVGFVLSHGEISNSVYQDELSVAKRTAGRDLSDLVDKGIFDKLGTTGVGVRYVMTERGHDWAKLKNVKGP